MEPMHSEERVLPGEPAKGTSPLEDSREDEDKSHPSGTSPSTRTASTDEATSSMVTSGPRADNDQGEGAGDEDEDMPPLEDASDDDEDGDE